MIRSWKDDASRRVWDQQKSGSFRGLDIAAAIDLLLALNNSRSLDDLAPLHSVGLRNKSRDKKRWTMTIDDRWRIRFDSRKGDAVDVKLIGKTIATPSDRKTAAKASHHVTRVLVVPAVHPGRFLKRELTARHLSANRLSLDLGVPSGRITDILNARRAITADTAVRLGRFFGMSAQFWCDLQSQFDIAVVEQKKGAEITRRVRAAKAG